MASDSAPHDRQAELGVIGCCLLGGAETVAEALDSLTPGSFGQDDCQSAMRVLSALATSGSEVNAVTFAREWQSTTGLRPSMEILGSQDQVPAPTMVDHYTARVADISTRRRLWCAAHGLLESIDDLGIPTGELLAKAEQEMLSSAPNVPRRYSGREASLMFIGDIEARHARQGAPTGIITGLMDLDFMLDGLQRGEQTIVAARPSMGKTAFGLSVLERACLMDQVPTLFLTLEMGVQPLMRRLAAMHCRIPMQALRKGQLTERQFEMSAVFSQRAAKAPLHIIDGVSGMTDAEVASSIRRAVRMHGVQLVIVDYLQKIRPTEKHEKRTYEVAQVSGTLKSVADKCKLALLTLAQVNRESEKIKGLPRLCDLADSGQIERDADVVALLHRERGENEGKAKLIMAKNRDGELGIIDLTFIGQYCRFESASNSTSAPIEH